MTSDDILEAIGFVLGTGLGIVAIDGCARQLAKLISLLFAAVMP